MTEEYYQGYLSGYANTGGRSTSPDWLAAYDRAREDNSNNVVDKEIYERFHKEIGKELPDES